MDEFNNIKAPNELLEFMDNIKYGFIGKNGKKYLDMFSPEWNDWYTECFVQTGKEVLESKIGTCYDQVEFERLWFSKNNYNFKTIFCWFEVNRENNLPTHTFLIYENDNKWYWFEHAFENYKGIHKFNNEKELLKFVKDKQFEYTKNNSDEIFDKDCLEFYEYNKPDDNLRMKEFLSFVTSKNKIDI